NGNDFEQYGKCLYHVTVMRTPAATGPGGWQLDGHHLIVNYFVSGDQAVRTAVVVGPEPIIATTGKYAGTKILQEEQDQGFAMMTALDAAQRRKATLQASKSGNNNLTEAFRDNMVIPYAGIRGAELSEAQRRRLLNLIALFVDNM